MPGFLPEPNKMFWFDCGRFLANPGHICGRGASLWCRNPLLSSNKFTQGHLMKTEGLITDLAVVRSPERAESG